MAGHCVLRLEDLMIMYQGHSAEEAASAAVPGTHWAEHDTISSAIVRAADEAGEVIRGRRSARTAEATEAGSRVGQAAN